LRNNARRNIDDAQLFEIGRTFRTADGVGGLRFNYSPSARGVKEDVRVQSAEKLPREQRTAGIAMMGRPWTSRWGGGEREVDFYWLKGMIEQTLSALAVPEVNFRAATHPTLHPGRTAKICVGKAVLGILGEVHPQVVKNFDLPGRAYLAEFNLDVIMELAGSLSAPPLLSRFPTVTRDVAFLAEELQAADQIESVINAAAGEYVESVALFDVYQGSHVPAGWRSLAYRITFRASERTLADAEVDEAMENIWQALRDKIGAKLR
jgi:phenylalanyl-tRNA synthetase beta chain